MERTRTAVRSPFEMISTLPSDRRAPPSAVAILFSLDRCVFGAVTISLIFLQAITHARRKIAFGSYVPASWHDRESLGRLRRLQASELLNPGGFSVKLRYHVGRTVACRPIEIYLPMPDRSAADRLAYLIGARHFLRIRRLFCSKESTPLQASWIGSGIPDKPKKIALTESYDAFAVCHAGRSNHAMERTPKGFGVADLVSR